MRTSGVCFSRMWVWVWMWVVAALRLTVAGDANYPHYGIQGMTYVGTNYVWGLHEIPHKVSWHDGYYGPELVKIELTTNVVPHATMTWDQQLGTTYFSNRVVRVTTPTSTNDVVVGVVGQRFEVTPPIFAPRTTPTVSKCSCRCCTNSADLTIISIPDRANRHPLDYHSVIVPYVTTD